VELDVQLCKTGELVVFHDLYTSGEFITIWLWENSSFWTYTLEKLYTEVPELQGTTVLSTSRAVTRVGSSLDLFSQKGIFRIHFL
jgi:glycerophosphoryl diester phosphodiesterase